MSTTAETVVAVIETSTLTYTDEVRLHEAMACVFVTHGIPHRREVPLIGAGRIDFLLDGGCGVEVKVGGQRSSTLAQLDRYAKHHDITSLVLVTTIARHLQRMPATLNGKPLSVVSLLGQAF